jgi:hypothetical protein
MELQMQWCSRQLTCLGSSPHITRERDHGKGQGCILKRPSNTVKDNIVTHSPL